MDPITALGVASAVVGFLEIGARIAKRLEELSKVGDVPKVFNDIRTRLPLILSIVSSIQETHEALAQDTQEAFESVVAACYDQIKHIERIVDKIAVVAGDSRFRKVTKAVLSLVEESRIQEISAALRDNIELLTMFKVAPAEKPQKSDERRVSTSTFRSNMPPPAYTDAVGIFLVPFERDPRFIGREAHLKEIEELFEKHGRVSVTGSGGVGKSQVAIEYAYRFKEYNEQSHVFWVYGGSISRFYQGYKRIAQNLALPGWDDPDISILELVSKWLNEASSSYLLILDNADDMLYYWPNKYKSGSHSDNPEANLSLHLPEAGESRKVLITSRDSRIASRLSRPSKPVLLQHMSIEEAIELFRSDLEGHGSTATEAEMGKVAKALDCLPLAITQAASFIDENCISVSEYLTALEGDDAEEFLQEELDDSRRDEDSINSTFRSWKLSFELISKQKPRAAELLSLLGMLDRQSIPKWLVKMPEVVTSAGVLQSFSLIFCPEGSQIFQLHRLCQRFVRLWLKRSGQVQKWQDAALKCVSEAYPTVVGLAQWPVCDALAPHVATVLDYEYTSEEARLDLAHLLCWAADFDVERGMYHQALTRAEKSHGLFKELVLSTDQRLAASTWCHGRILYYEARSQSDLMQAREILQQGLNIADKSSWIYAECAYELAQSAYALGKREECLKMAKLNVDCWQRIEGMGDLRTLDIMHDYALALAMSGHRAEAISQWQEILDLYPKCNASADTKSIYMYRSMAGMAEFRGDASTAEILYAKLVALGSSIYGIQHIHVFDYRLSHAEQILRLNQPKKAFELCQSILRSCINKSEWRIPTTCYEIMAECCSIEHDDPGEEEWWLKAVDMHQRHSEGTQRRGMEVLEAAARCLLVNSKPQQAKKLLGQVFTWREAELSLDDSSTLDALELIGVCNAHQEQNDDAAADFTVVATHSPALNPRVTYNICTTLWNRQLWQDLEQRCSDALQEDQGSEFAPDLYQMQAVARGKLGRTEEALISKFKQLIDSTSRIKEGSRLLPVIPPGPSEIPPRFRRIIHPRTWSA